ncbi:MAG: type IX secretion system outer membrane channel protein PorV [Flavobacteriaceae bacterium]
MKFSPKKINTLILILCFIAGIGIGSAQSDSRVITTGVPFLLITPDARAAGMGELGVASLPDVFSQQWNPAKYAFFSKDQALGVSYTPYLSKLVNDIFLGNMTYYTRVSERSSWAASLKYFSLGDIQFNEIVGGTIVDQGLQRPNEITLDLSYALKLSETFSMAVAGRFIRSDLKIATDVDTQAANTLGVDIAAYYQGNQFEWVGADWRFRSGVNISNIGPRLNYDLGGQKNFIPTNLKLGTGLDLVLDDSNSLGFHTEFNKLLVPSPVAVYDDQNEFLGYQQPDMGFLEGIIESFGDAPDGFQEELKEITWAVGLEYIFQNVLALRTGYFNESLEKGARRFLTFGVGMQLNRIDFDVSYLFSTSTIRNPLENTLRFSLTFNMSKFSPEETQQ